MYVLFPLSSPAKLAEATSTLFAQAHLATQRDPTLLEWLVKSGYSWHLHVLQQHFCYRAAAHLAEAKALLEGVADYSALKMLFLN